MHLFDEAVSETNVIVLNENPVAFLSENVGDLARNGCYRAATAQEEIVSLTGTAWHGTDPADRPESTNVVDLRTPEQIALDNKHWRATWDPTYRTTPTWLRKQEAEYLKRKK